MNLDSSIINQLKEVFKSLENEVQLVLSKSSHPKQEELRSLLIELASTSNNIKIIEDSNDSLSPHFFIRYKEKNTGISFTGIPGGHEFSSLVIAIINTDGKGKIPDDSIKNRILSITDSPISLKTIISLTCENCPEVVQSLNLLSLINPLISHEMIDGEFIEEEKINKIGIQGVPSVVNEFKSDTPKIIFSGKTSFEEILVKLEGSFKKNSDQEIMNNLGDFDVTIIGGGPAGVSSAIYSARKGLSVAIIASKMGGQIQETKGIENFISIPYTEGPLLSAELEKHIKNYSVKIFEHRKVLSIKNESDKNKKIFLKNEFLSTKSIIVASGAKWRTLNIKGEKEYLGRGVAFCPHCDGPFYKDKDIIVVGGGNSGVEAAIDLSNIAKSVTLIELGNQLRADKVLIDKMNSIKNISTRLKSSIVEILGNDLKVTSVILEKESNREEILIDGIFIQIGLVPNSEFIKDLVLVNSRQEIIIDEKNRTNIPFIYGAGDVTNTPYKQIVIAVGEGAKASLTCFEDLSFK